MTLVERAQAAHEVEIQAAKRHASRWFASALDIQVPPEAWKLDERRLIPFRSVALRAVIEDELCFIAAVDVTTSLVDLCLEGQPGFSITSVADLGECLQKRTTPEGRSRG
jgi:hypothetical protein